MGSVLFEKHDVALHFFSVALLMATESISSTTSWKEEVEKKRQETEELQNKLQDASALQALREPAFCTIAFYIFQTCVRASYRDFIVVSSLNWFLVNGFKF